MLSNIIHYFWSDLDDDEIRKYSILSIIFFLIIGSTWLLRSLKNIIFLKIAFPEILGYPVNHGLLMQPTAKFWTPLITIPLLLFYSKMIDWYKKETIYYIIIICYTIIFTSISIILALDNAYENKQLLSLIGWITFFSVETFYSLIIALLWSFTNSICTAASAQKGYPIIIVMAQIACLVVSIPLLRIDYCGDIWVLFLCATGALFSTIFIMRYLMRTISAHQLVDAKLETIRLHDGFFKGCLSGLYLLCKHPYLVCILIISASYEIIAQIIEYQMLTTASMHTPFATVQSFAQFQGVFGIAIHVVSLLIALYGTHYFIKRYSLMWCLLAVPITLLIMLNIYLIFCSVFNPTHTHLLWATMSIVVCMNGLGFAFNNPVKEIMYITTSKDVTFKSKSWIDVFGTRVAKQSGAHLNHVFKHDISRLIILGSLCSMGLTIIWIIAALYAGNKNKKLLETKTCIE